MRLEIETSENNQQIVRVILSRRNLMALLDKLDWNDSACTIFGSHSIFVDGVKQESNHISLFVSAENNDDHYVNREHPGVMHPATEATIRAIMARRN